MMSMDGLCGGALLQKFNLEMARIGQNILNPNTNAKKARKLVITLTFKPDDSRQMVETGIQVQSTLAPQEPVTMLMLAGQDLRSGMINLTEYGSGAAAQQAVTAPSEALPVQVETIPPERVDADYKSGRPIDLRNSWKKA